MPAAQVRHTYFQARRGNRLTLYADAHADQRTLQPIPLPGGRVYQPASCWDDLLGALMAAKYFIYITGVLSALSAHLRRGKMSRKMSRVPGV